MTVSNTCRCTVAYALDGPDDGREEWIVDTVLDWMADGLVGGIEVGRTDLDGETDVEVLVEVAVDCESAVAHALEMRLLAELPEGVDASRVTVRPGGRITDSPQ